MIKIKSYALKVAMLIIVVNCAVKKNHIKSSDYPNRNEKITVLKQYLKMHSEILDAEYDIYDVNLNAEQSIPGATHRDYRIALHLKNGDGKKWLSDVTITSFPKDNAWCRELIIGKEGFKIQNEKDFWTYSSKNKQAFYFEKDAVLCMRIYQD